MTSTGAREFLRSHVLGLVAMFIALTGTAVASQQSGTSDGPKASASVVTDAKFKKLKKRVAALEAKTSLPPSGPAGGVLDGTYPNPGLANNSVGATEIIDGSVGLADTNNSLHQQCPAGTVYIVGSCVDQASQGGDPGVTYNNAEAGCAVRPGGRLASAHELSTLVRGGFGTIPNGFSWALEATGGGEAEIVTQIGAVGSQLGTNTNDYRCAFSPLG
jgi:hypothetical protein